MIQSGKNANKMKSLRMDAVTYAERDRRRLSWRLRLGLGEPEELDEEEDRELEEPEWLEPDELDPLEDPELEPELLLEVELDLDLVIVIKRKTYYIRKCIFRNNAVININTNHYIKR